jgi:hypothetical protein
VFAVLIKRTCLSLEPGVVLAIERRDSSPERVFQSTTPRLRFARSSRADIVE